MENRKKLHVLSLVIYVLIFFLAILAIVFKDNQVLMITFISIIVILFILVVILDRKLKSLDKEYEQKLDEDYEKEKQKAFAIIEENASSNERFSLMNSLIKHEIIEVASLVKKYNLHYDFDVVFEDKYFDFMIEGDISKKKKYYFSFSTQKGEWTLILNLNDKEKKLINETNDEIINLIISDIKNSFKEN